MSGGTFNYSQDYIIDIIRKIEKEIKLQGKPCPEFPEYTCEEFSEEVNEKLKEAIYHLKKAYIYANRADWFLAGDDGEESFLERLDEELKKFEKEYKNGK